MRKLLQTTLVYETNHGDFEERQVWLYEEDGFKVGDLITLKDSEDPSKLWEVKKIWGGPTDKAFLDAHRGWNNNI